MLEGAIGGHWLDAGGCPVQDDPHPLSRVDGESRAHSGTGIGLEFRPVAERQSDLFIVTSLGEDTGFSDLNLRFAAAVVEAWVEEHLHFEHALAPLDETQHLVERGARVPVPGHEIGHDGGALAGAAEEGLEHVGRVVVGLQTLEWALRGGHPKATAPVRVQESGEYARGVEAGQA